MSDLKNQIIKQLYTAQCRPEMEGEPGSCPYRRDGLCREINKLDLCAMGLLADLIIGSILPEQQWIPVAERLPEPPEGE